MRSSPTPTRTRTRSWSIACSPARTTASGWRCRGSMRPATPTATAFSRTATPGNGSGATGSCRRSTTTCRSISSRSGNSPATCCPNATTEQKIASGFNRNHLLNGEGGAIAEEQRFVILFDRIDTTATTWLGLTMACAQCHDHKYDPITQRDYYSLLDAFNRVPESGTPQRQSSRIRVAAPFLELPTEENKAKLAEFEAQIAAARSRSRSRCSTRRLRAGGPASSPMASRPKARACREPDAAAAQARSGADRRREEVDRSRTAQALRREGAADARRQDCRQVGKSKRSQSNSPTTRATRFRASWS